MVLVSVCFWHVLCLLTIDGESHSPGQVRVQVVEVQPLALVNAAVSAFDGLEGQEAILAFDGFVLKGGEGRQMAQLSTEPSHDGRAEGKRHARLCRSQTRAAGFRQSRTSW